MSAANRRRGANAERSIVNYLRTNGWPDARRYLAGDGRQPGDIDWHPLVSLEVKDVAGSAWPSWCRQAVAAAPTGTVPVVVRRERGVTDVGLWPCRVRWMDAREALGVRSPFHVMGRPERDDLDDLHVVDDEPWMATHFGRFVAAVAALDTPPENEGKTA